MPKVKYLDRSMHGTYWVDCEVVQKVDDNCFKIEVWDEYEEQFASLYVSRNELKFPKFSELVM